LASSTYYPTLPENLNEIQQKSIQRTSLGWLRFQFHQRNNKESFEFNLEKSIEFMFKNEEIVNIRKNLLEKMQKIYGNAQCEEKEILSFKIKNHDERVFVLKLLNFVDILEECISSRNVEPLTEYTLEIINIINIFANREEPEKVLLEAGLQILTRAFDILGII
jgi:arginyl-tRNA synthetase